MPEYPNKSLRLPGYYAGPGQIPGVAKRMRQRAQAGYGTAGSEQAEANRLFRTRAQDEYTAPLKRRIFSVSDVTYGLGLDQATEASVRRLVDEHVVEYAKKGQTQRVFLAAGALTQTLRALPNIPADARLEIVKRARAYWRNTQTVDYGKPPTIRSIEGTQTRNEGNIMKRSGVFVAKQGKLAKAAVAEQETEEAAQKQKAPQGFQPIPNSKHGGYRKKAGEGWVYWYPGAGETSTPHPADRGQARAKQKMRLAKPQSGTVPTGGQEQPSNPMPVEEGTSASAPEAAQGAKPNKGKLGVPKGKLTSIAGGKAGKGKAPQAATQGTSGETPEDSLASVAGAAATHQPTKTQTSKGTVRQYHPQVQAHVPKGKEKDAQHHASEYKKHQAEKQKALAQGDQEKAKGHTFAMNFHAGEHNKIQAAAKGQAYAPAQQFPGAENDDAGAPSNDLAPGPQKGQEEASASPEAPGAQGASPSVGAGKETSGSSRVEKRSSFVPQSASVRGMRERVGQAMEVMADLSQAHDHLSALRAKRLEFKRSNHPMRRRLLSQVDAEIAATKHDIVQLEEAHDQAIAEVGKFQAELRKEKIRANPIFRAFMEAMQKLQAMSQALGSKMQSDAPSEATKKKFNENFANAASKMDEADEFKPLGVSKEDVASKYGDPEAAAAKEKQNKDALAALDKMDRADAEQEQASPPSPEAGKETSDADEAFSDIFSSQKEREMQTAKRAQQDAESSRFDKERQASQARRDQAEGKAQEAADKWERRMSGKTPKAVMREQLATEEDAPEDLQETQTPARKKRMQKSAALVSTPEWRQVMVLGVALNKMLKKHQTVRFAIQAK